MPAVPHRALCREAEVDRRRSAGAIHHPSSVFRAELSGSPAIWPMGGHDPRQRRTGQYWHETPSTW